MKNVKSQSDINCIALLIFCRHYQTLKRLVPINGSVYVMFNIALTLNSIPNLQMYRRLHTK